jgi:multidrug efflux pump subunit AcrA (membrane-fusion protein)
MNPNVDLRQLAIRRENPMSPPRAGRRSHLVTRYLIPAGVLLGFATVFAWAARDSLMSAQPVTVVPVLATRSAVQQGGAALFQAAGWVEPRPTPVLVTALAEGVVEQLLVVEGQEVHAGAPVAKLIEADARLALRMTEADLRLRQADRDAARAAEAAARTNSTQPVHLQAALAEADAMLAQKETDVAEVPFQRRTAQAREQLARRDYEGKAKASGAVAEITLHEARKELETATAAVEQLTVREDRLKREVKALTAKRDALRQRLELKTEESRQLAEAVANLQAAEARVQQAQVAVDGARLRLERTVVRAPVGGRVLALLARPGMRLMGLVPGSLQDSSTVVSLYDPASLQVRADVRLEDVPRVQSGQPARIETPAVPGGLDGEVLQATSQANIQKNTLEVKLAVKAPPPVLKPDMLVQVTFLAPTVPDAPATESETLRLLVYRQLVESGESGARVWVADQAAGVARQRSVKLGPAVGDLVEVTEGLTPADKLIGGGREGLRDGQRIVVTGEDATFGVATAPGFRSARNPDGAHKGKQ